MYCNHLIAVFGLQKNRSDLMLQLETLIRLMVISNGSNSTVASEKTHSMDLDGLMQHSSVILPCTPLSSTRFTHGQNRRIPEHPPKRSSSLCYPSENRLQSKSNLLPTLIKVKCLRSPICDNSWPFGLTQWG